MRGAYLKHFAVNFDAEVMPMQQIRTELRRLGNDFSYCGFEGDKRHFDVGGLLAGRIKLRFPRFRESFIISS